MSSNMLFLILSILATVISTILVVIFQPEIIGFKDKVRKESNNSNLPIKGAEIL